MAWLYPVSVVRSWDRIYFQFSTTNVRDFTDQHIFIFCKVFWSFRSIFGTDFWREQFWWIPCLVNAFLDYVPYLKNLRDVMVTPLGVAEISRWVEVGNSPSPYFKWLIKNVLLQYTLSYGRYLFFYKMIKTLAVSLSDTYTPLFCRLQSHGSKVFERLCRFEDTCTVDLAYSHNLARDGKSMQRSPSIGCGKDVRLMLCYFKIHH